MKGPVSLTNVSGIPYKKIKCQRFLSQGGQDTLEAM